jgi:hypothetical protein
MASTLASVRHDRPGIAVTDWAETLKKPFDSPPWRRTANSTPPAPPTCTPVRMTTPTLLFVTDAGIEGFAPPGVTAPYAADGRTDAQPRSHGWRRLDPTRLRGRRRRASTDGAHKSDVMISIGVGQVSYSVEEARRVVAGSSRRALLSAAPALGAGKRASPTVQS